jgi:hypothetical protein
MAARWVAMKRKLVSVSFGVLMGVAAIVGGADRATAQATKSAGKIVRLEVTIIEGRVQRPNAFFINTRQAIVYDVMEMRESFTDEIPKAIRTGKF